MLKKGSIPQEQWKWILADAFKGARAVSYSAEKFIVEKIIPPKFRAKGIFTSICRILLKLKPSWGIGLLVSFMLTTSFSSQLTTGDLVVAISSSRLCPVSYHHWTWLPLFLRCLLSWQVCIFLNYTIISDINGPFCSYCYYLYKFFKCNFCYCFICCVSVLQYMPKRYGQRLLSRWGTLWIVCIMHAVGSSRI